MLEPSKNRASVEKNREGNCWKTKTKLEKKLCVGIAILSIVAFVFLLLFITRKTCSVSDEECIDKHCVQASSELLNFVDLKENPCEDFYHYVCGRYIKEAVKKGAPTPILEVMNEFKNELKSIVVEDIKKKDTKANIAMKKFYKACMNESSIDNEKHAAFLDAIDQLGGWPLYNSNGWKLRDNFDWIDWNIKSTQLGLSILGFFTFRPAAGERNTTLLRISNSALYDQEYGLSRDQFENVINTIIKDFKIKSVGLGGEIAKMYNLMKMLGSIDPIEEEDDDDEEISTIEKLYEKCPQFDWLRLLNGLAGNILQFKNDSEVIFGDNIDKYCYNLEGVLKESPKELIVNYFIWSIIQINHDFMTKKIRDVYEEFKENSNEDRFTVCYGLTDERFKFLKETVYIRKKTKPEVRSQIDELVEIMKEVFIEHIKVSTWMDEETKKRAIDKTKLIEKIVGADKILYDVEKFDKIMGVDELEFPEDNMFKILMEKTRRENKQLWYSLYVERPENWYSFFNNANQVNAFFAMSLNLMIIPAPILNSVFFNYKMPAYMNYGAIGRVVGHEIMHGFGESGRFVTLEDDETVDWWTNSTVDAFQTTKQCVIDEYEKIPYRYRLNGTLTLEENLADFVSTDVAYEAYLKWEKKYGPEKKLPGIPLTPKQIFWIKTGAFLCFRKLDDEEIDLTKADDHAIPNFRVSYGARNSLYFAKDFNCPVGSFMNPKEKCRIL